MPRPYLLVIAILLAMAILPVEGAHAETAKARNISWDDLVPWSEPIPDPFEKLDIDDKIELGYIYDIRKQLALGYIPAGDMNTKFAEELTEKLTAKGLDVDALLAADQEFRNKVEAEGAKVVSSLDGVIVKLPGYALPLEFSGKSSKKFLLVPYVGACIHSPPPPPNQLIVVELETPYAIENVFDPIVIEGKLSTTAKTEELHLVDGSADIHSGYTMKGLKIAPYEE